MISKPFSNSEINQFSCLFKCLILMEANLTNLESRGLISTASTLVGILQNDDKINHKVTTKCN